ncbi:MAG: phenylacetate--CoA ligase family protein [Candidatus Eisenbacteria bacterium]|nr:phenylacetate--CoA ligase family protein [Candidatus Eisenbacteria bacterium]
MNPALARWLYYSAQSLRGENVRGVLADLEVSQRWPIERLSDQQWERQRSLAAHAFETVPFYRERWSAAGFLPDALVTRADWAKLPSLGKSDLREQGERLRSSRAPAGLKATTSGSSGTPIAVLRSHASWAHAHANVLRGWRWHGLDAGDRYAYFWGLALDESGRRQAALRDAFFNRARLSAFDVTPERAREFSARLRSWRPCFAFGYPSAVTNFADEVAAQKLDGRAIGFRAIVTTAEVLKVEQRERLERTFGCPVADSYGCAEAGVAGFECEAGGMHVPVESVVVDLESAGDGRFEVLLTDLFNRSEPVIRYRVGDIVGPAPASCACGRGLPLLGPIDGRAGDFITLPDGRVINGLLPYYIFRPHAKSGEVREYQFVEFSGGRIELRVRPGETWNDGARAAIEAEVTEGLGIPVALVVVDHVERAGRGKFRDWIRSSETGA